MTRPLRPELRRTAGTPALPLWAACCFLVSGAAGLLYEVAWSKQFAYLLGSSLHAVATVVAAFLCGLALGARLLGVPLARRGSGGRIYAFLELGVAVLGVVSLPALRGIEPWIGVLYRGFGGETGGFAVVRFLLLFALLVPPAALMGATLPVLVAYFERGLVGPALARLYAINTLGAVTGSVLGGFLLLPGLGLMATTWVAAALNVLAAVVALRSAPAAAPQGAATPEPAAARGAATSSSATGVSRPLLAVLFALSGFAALVFQVAWVRLFSLMLGSSVYSFSAVLGVYLLGLALGSAAVAGAMRRGVSLAGFGQLQLSLAAVAALMMLAFPQLPEWSYAIGARTGASWGLRFFEQVLVVGVMLLVPCALLGAVFPIATRLLQRGDGGHAAGFAYAVNTAGTIAGSLVAGFVAVPRLGVQGTHLAALMLSAAVGVTALVMARARGEAPGRALVSGGVLVAAVAVLALLAPRWDPALMTSGVYRPVQASRMANYSRLSNARGGTVYRGTREQRVVMYREGINGSVIVTSDPLGSTYALSVGGKVDASTDDMETQIMLGLIPAALADSGARSLVIGLGSGATAAAALAGGAGPTDVVELEPAVAAATRFFHAPGENPLDDPRVHLVLGDARTLVAHGSGKYGLIVSEPSNPWIAGVNNLFTVDFYTRVRARLEPDGVFCQWVQLYELSPATFGTLVASFLEVFPEGQVFSIWRAADLLLVAVPPGRSLNLSRLGSPAARRQLARAGRSGPGELAGFWAGPLSALRPAGAGAALNRDDRPVVEYRAPRDMIEVGAAAGASAPPVLALVPFETNRPAGALFSHWPEETWYRGRSALLMDHNQRGLAGRVLSAVESSGAEFAPRVREDALRFERRIQAQNAVGRATELVMNDADEQAVAVLRQAVALDPSHGRAWLLLGDRLRALGRLAAADSALAVALGSADPEVRSDGHMIGGMVELARQRPREAAERFLAAQRDNPQQVRNYTLEERARDAAGDPAGALAALERGAKALPSDPEIASRLAARRGAR